MLQLNSPHLTLPFPNMKENLWRPSVVIATLKVFGLDPVRANHFSLLGQNVSFTHLDPFASDV